ncbi:MAG: hypothetical protein CMJ58_20535 [Planctomycetaceae bacterium]|nr:hypothetical protein [Planctomycetaceae bacterium]
MSFPIRTNVTHAAALLVGVTFLLASAHHAHSHGGGLLIQTLDDTLVTGLDDDLNNMEIMGVRSFAGLFPSFNAWNDPGFMSLTTPPAGYGELPAGADVYWDFLPMNVGGVTSNLLYWDGSGATPQFGLPSQPGTTMTLIGRNNQLAAADGTDAMIPGKVLEKTLTSSTGSLRLHAHQYWSLEVAGGASPVEGFYLSAVQVRMDGFKTSQPFYVTWGTLNVSVTTLNDVVTPWVEEHADDLVRPGDFDFSGAVDGADLLAWQRHEGLSGPFPIDNIKADGDGNNLVDAADLTIWADNYGGGATVPASLISAAVPEPTAIVLTACGAAALLWRRRGVLATVR